MRIDFRELAQTMSEERKDKLRMLYKCAEAVVELLDTVAPLADNDNGEGIKVLNKYLEQLEFEMQGTWGVNKDANYHTWWLRPQACTCPKLDNTDPAYFGSGHIIVEDCPLHGRSVKND